MFFTKTMRTKQNAVLLITLFFAVGKLPAIDYKARERVSASAIVTLVIVTHMRSRAKKRIDNRESKQTTSFPVTDKLND